MIRLLCLLLLFLAACSSPPSVLPALINDNAGAYRVVKVDGHDPKRWTTQFVTVVPHVELTAGKHTLTLERYSAVARLHALVRNATAESVATLAPQPLALEVEVSNGFIYEIVEESGGLRLVEASPRTF